MKAHKPLTTLARRLRQSETDAERRLWSILRDHRFGGFSFRRQHPMRGFILDFYCPKAKLCIELDGGQHFKPEHIEKDRLRDEKLRDHGVTVLRFENGEFLKNTRGAAEVIRETLMRLVPARAPSPPPCPPPGVPGRG